MKTIRYISAIALLLTLGACKDYLEAPLTTDMNEDMVFSDRTLAERFVTGIYADGMPQGFSMSSSNLDRRLVGTSTLGSACDEAEEGPTWGKGNGVWNVDIHNNTSIDWDEDPRYAARWGTTRKCNIVIERVGEVPYDPGDPGFNQRALGEAYFMRALVFWESVYRYGGMPIVDHRFTAGEETKLPRSSFAACVQAIVDDCNTAAGLLPDFYTDNTKVGRATRIAALALKARVLLYAASPLFNTGTPYLSLGANNTLICYGNYDRERWNTAATAAKEAIEAVEASGHYGIYNTGNPLQDYETVWTTPDTKEIILSNKKYRGFSTSTRPLTNQLPQWAGSGYSDGGLFATFNFVKFYEKRADGTKQSWSATGGDDLIEKYKELDPRFDQTIGAHGLKWTDEIGVLNFIAGAAHSVTYDKTRHLVRKWVPRYLKATSPKNSGNVDWIVFRVAELYLNYAEALNEYNATPPQTAYDAVKKVRDRAGMPAFPAGMQQGPFRDKLRTERAVELAFEDHRFWDIRRWLIAGDDGVMKGDMYGLTITAIAGQTPTTKAHYQPYVFEKRYWSDRSYLHPIKQTEVDKGYLVQNPGW